MNAAAMVRTSAALIISAHMEGVTIRARNKKYLAIPTEHAKRIAGANRRKRISPANWPANKGKLRFIPIRGGPDLLVLEEARLTRSGRVSLNTRTKKGRLRSGTATLVMFVLVPQVSLKRRPINVDSVVNRVANMLPTIIKREYRTNPVKGAR